MTNARCGYTPRAAALLDSKGFTIGGFSNSPGQGFGICVSGSCTKNVVPAPAALSNQICP
jgi:hypothetical protein